MALPHAAPGEKVPLPTLSISAPDAKTRALVKTDGFETVHLVLRAGTRIAPHAVEGHITLHGLEGAVDLALEGRRLRLEPGDWLYLEPGETHGLEAAEDSALLLTILFARR